MHRRTVSNLVLIAALLTLTTVRPAEAQTPAAGAIPMAQPAIDGILDAFKTHPLVGLGDAHGVAQELDFYATLVRDPRFARDVGNVVVEFGNSAHQGIIDRYVDGKDVPYTELRKVWMDAFGFGPGGATYLGMANFYAQVRATNLALPPEQRIRVWLGDPAIDWTKIKSEADLTPLRKQRDSSPARIINQNILARGKRALVIYGGAHFMSKRLDRATPGNPASEAVLRRGLEQQAQGYAAQFGAFRSFSYAGKIEGGWDVYDVLFAKGPVRFKVVFHPRRDAYITFIDGLMIQPSSPVILVNAGDLAILDEVARPGAFFIAMPYRGVGDRRCNEVFERAAAAWPVPSLAPPMQGSEMEKVLLAAGCETFSSDLTEARLLYLGPAAQLTVSPRLPDAYLDPDYMRMVSERTAALAGRPTAANGPLIINNPATGAKDQPALSGPPPARTPGSTEQVRMEAFGAADANKDGRLDRMEYSEALKALRVVEPLDQLFVQRDINRDYFISAEEYRRPLQ